MRYDEYNREERAICSHLFRLLFEKLATDPENSGLAAILNVLVKKSLNFSKTCNFAEDIFKIDLSQASIYTEVALIRDAYHVRKPDIEPFMNRLVSIVAIQEQVKKFRIYSELPEDLKNPKSTHPRQIKMKADKTGVKLTDEERKIYGAIQVMYNAKPDLAIAVDKYLIVFEAKFTEPFDGAQMQRTNNIARVWAELLYEDLGFADIPIYTVAKLSDKKQGVDLSWQEVLEVARTLYGTNDRSLLAFEKGVKLLEA